MAVAPESIEIRDVWRANLEEEFRLIRSIVDDYKYVSMDTEFPGIVIPSDGRPFDYKSMKDNVEQTKLIQLGLCFSDAAGNLPTCGDKHLVWQFNFCEFDREKDSFNKDSIALLERHGIDFDKNVKDGVAVSEFGGLLMSSGAVLPLTTHLCWITFHGVSDFGYLLRLLRGSNNLPETKAEFLALLKVFFPVFYDIKVMAQKCQIYGGLDHVARKLKESRLACRLLITEHLGLNVRTNWL
uniref:poly(A)-specific ribonuclease n=1 Tax=Kalanchoe fedtschenkoi TaxID=63787 RepID=A0A7N0TVX9_KALFE